MMSEFKQTLTRRLGRLAPLAILLFFVCAATARASYIYVLNDVTGAPGSGLYGFNFNETTGGLTLLPGFPVAAGVGGGGFPSKLIAIDAVNKRLYVLSNGTNPHRIMSFSINPATGALTQLFQHFPLDSSHYGTISMHPSGSPVVVGRGLPTAAARSLNVTQAGLVEAQGSPYSAGTAQPASSAFAPGGNFLYMGGNSNSTIAGFSVEAGTGVLTALAGSPFEAGANFPGSYAIDSQNRLFSANWNSETMRVFTTSSGIPTPVSGNPFASGLGDVVFGALHPNEQFYYVADRKDNKIGAFKINGSGAATTLNSVAAPVASNGTHTNGFIINQTGSFLIAENAQSYNLTTFRIDPGTGVLTRISTQPFGVLGSTGYLAGIVYLQTTLPANKPFDFDGDGKTDVSVFRPALGQWWLDRSSAGLFATSFGVSTDKIAPADFTGDGKTDLAIWRPSTGEWFVVRSDEGFSQLYAFAFGTSGDIPAPGDFDGDGKADATVFRPSAGVWYTLRSSDGGVTITQFGLDGDRPVVADYDGDGRSDIAIFRPGAGQWWLLRSTAGPFATSFGVSSDKTAQGDYTGDGKADLAIWRPSTGEWFVVRSDEGFSQLYGFPFGTVGDIPAAGDYDGDGKFDATVFRPSNATWYELRSTGGFFITGFGADGDLPVPSVFTP